MRHHTIITGTGRAGTTFLVQLLTKLGLDTGFDSNFMPIDGVSHSGLEWDIRFPEAPYVVKSPFLCDYLEDAIREHELVIDHAIVPVRELHCAISSRAKVQGKQQGKVIGGLWDASTPEEQCKVLLEKFYKLICTLGKYDISTTLLYFPRTTEDPVYLYKKLKFLLTDIEYGQFLQAFNQTVQPDFIHEFEGE